MASAHRRGLLAMGSPPQHDRAELAVCGEEDKRQVPSAGPVVNRNPHSELRRCRQSTQSVYHNNTRPWGLYDAKLNTAARFYGRLAKATVIQPSLALEEKMLQGLLHISEDTRGQIQNKCTVVILPSSSFHSLAKL